MYVRLFVVHVAGASDVATAGWLTFVPDATKSHAPKAKLETFHLVSSKKPKKQTTMQLLFELQLSFIYFAARISPPAKELLKL